MLPEAVLAFVTNEQSTAARQAKPSLRNHSTASQSGRPKSSRGSSRPFQLSRISPLSRDRRRVIIFFKVCFHLRRLAPALFLCRVVMRHRKRALCHRAIRPRRLCEAFGPVIEKGHGRVFLPRGARFVFPAFPERTQSAGANSGQLETEGKHIEIHTDTNDK